MELEALLRSANVRRFQQNEVIFREGDPPDEGVYFLLSGFVRACKTDESTGKEVVLNYMPRGTMFGEIGLILKSPRSSSVIACANDTRVVSVNRAVFLEQAATNFDFIRGMLRLTIRRITRLQEEAALNRWSMAWHLPDELRHITEENRRHALKLQELLNNMRNMNPGPRTTIFAEGAKPDGRLFLIVDGEVGLFKAYGDDERFLGTWESGDIFGYMHLLEEPRRQYTARTLERKTRLIFLDQTIFYKIMHIYPDCFYNIYRTILTHLLVYQSNFLEARKAAELGLPPPGCVWSTVAENAEQSDETAGAEQSGDAASAEQSDETAGAEQSGDAASAEQSDETAGAEQSGDAASAEQSDVTASTKAVGAPAVSEATDSVASAAIS